MIIYKCDGHEYEGGRKCHSTYEAIDEKDYPERWIVISGKIKNGNPDAHTIERNGTCHFCSRLCLEATLFKTITPKTLEP